MNLPRIEIKTYDEWREHFGELKPLKRDYIEEQIKELSDRNNSDTISFIKFYGEEYTQTIISYFKRALSEIE